MTEFLLMVLAVYTAQLLHGLIFTLFKASKYEDTLAKKVASEVKRELKNER